MNRQDAAQRTVPEGPEGTPREGESRLRIAAFMLVFLVCTFTVLAGYRFATGTPAMNWYLYQVARHTAWLLGWAGHSSPVESDEMYRGREVEIRTELRGAVPSEPKTAAQVSEDSAPLTSWEIWQYRALQARRNAELDEDKLRLLTALPPVHGAGPAALDASIRKTVAGLENAMSRPGACRPVQVAPPEVVARLKECRIRFGALVRNPALGDDLKQQELTNIAAQLEDIVRILKEFLNQRAMQSRQQLRQMGPNVFFVARQGLRARLHEARQQLAAAQTDTSAPEEARKKRVANLSAAVSELEAQWQKRQQENPNNANADQVAFRFALVPECGAAELMGIFFAAVVAFPTRWWKKGLGVLLGVPLLYVLNLLRLACLAMIGAWTRQGPTYEIAHQYIWQGIFIFFVALLWLVWVELMVRREWPWQNPAS
ncbi:MAG: archaeosortase/exosortase family protein [Candidatus Hydrogenedentes bacterium]|nr:archaeosortase/exosortase family protein [Candidatus Hydrogenedentota bacterium]